MPNTRQSTHIEGLKTLGALVQTLAFKYANDPLGLGTAIDKALRAGTKSIIAGRQRNHQIRVQLTDQRRAVNRQLARMAKVKVPE